jgi:hypothetical protein
MAATYYATATTKDGKSVVISNLPNIYHLAVNEAEAHAKKQGLKLEYVRPVQGTQRQGGTTAKKFANGSPTPRSKRK